MKGLKLLSVSAALAALSAFAGYAGASPVPFQDGGVGPVLQITGFDWAPGSAYAEAGNQAVANYLNGAGSTQFVSDFHAKLAVFLGSGGPIGTPAAGEYTFTMRLTEKVDAVVVLPNGTAIAAFSHVPSPVQFFEMYYDATADADPLLGTGYNDGRLIWRGNITGANSNFQTTDNYTRNGVLSVNQAVVLPDGIVDVGALDQSANGNQVPNTRTVFGTGSTSLFADTVEHDTAFFKVDPGFLTFDIFSTTQALPYGSVDPSDAYGLAAYLGAIGSINPGGGEVSFNINGGIPGAGIGLVNGHLSVTSLGPDWVALPPPVGFGLGGPDIMFQTDASNDFSTTIIPEPMSAALGLMGLGALALAIRRRRPA